MQLLIDFLHGVILHLYGLMFLDLLSRMNTILYAIMFVVVVVFLFQVFEGRKWKIDGVRKQDHHQVE